jgi:hypothetical protein
MSIRLSQQSRSDAARHCQHRGDQTRRVGTLFVERTRARQSAALIGSHYLEKEVEHGCQEEGREEAREEEGREEEVRVFKLF